MKPGSGPPVHDYRNQNARILDDVRKKAAIPLGQDFGLAVEPTLQPVVVVDPLTAPLPAFFGLCPFAVGPAIGFRSEVIVGTAGSADRNSVIEFYFEIFAPVAGFSWEIIFNPTPAAATSIATPNSDNRQAWGQDLSTAQAAVFVRNTAAAVGGGLRAGQAVFQVASQCPRYGPIIIDASKATPGGAAGPTVFLLRPTADNVAINGVVYWRTLQRNPS